MQVATLKNIIIQKISEINDVSFLEAVNKILETKKETEIIYLNNLIKGEISESKKEISEGLFIEHDTLNEEVNLWLKEK